MNKRVVDSDDIPALATFYLRLYNRIPKCRLPGTNLNLGFMLFWMIVFFMLRWMYLYVFFSCGWPRNNKSSYYAVASFIGGFFHATQIVPLTYVLITSQKPRYNPSATSKVSPTWWNQATDGALQLCTAYMVYDFFFLVWVHRIPGKGIVLDNEAIMYMIHHFMTSFYMTTCRIFEAGQSSALTCIFLGEFTNTSFNTYFIFEMARKVDLSFSPFVSQFVTPIELFTAALYLLFRVILSPVILSYVSYNLLKDSEIRIAVPLFMRAIWICLMAAVIYGSIGQNVIFVEMLKEKIGWKDVESEL
jgi:hypothetical protein